MKQSLYRMTFLKKNPHKLKKTRTIRPISLYSDSFLGTFPLMQSCPVRRRDLPLLCVCVPCQMCRVRRSLSLAVTVLARR